MFMQTCFHLQLVKSSREEQCEVVPRPSDNIWLEGGQQQKIDLCMDDATVVRGLFASVSSTGPTCSAAAENGASVI